MTTSDPKTTFRVEEHRGVHVSKENTTAGAFTGVQRCVPVWEGHSGRWVRDRRRRVER